MTALQEFLREEIEAGSFPGASALVASADGIRATAFANCRVACWIFSANGGATIKPPISQSAI